jgi:hypothetical protein
VKNKDIAVILLLIVCCVQALAYHFAQPTKLYFNTQPLVSSFARGYAIEIGEPQPALALGADNATGFWRIHDIAIDESTGDFGPNCQVDQPQPKARP